MMSHVFEKPIFLGVLQKSISLGYKERNWEVGHGKTTGRAGGEHKGKREKECRREPPEASLSPLGLCGLLECGLLFRAADCSAAGQSFSAFPSTSARGQATEPQLWPH